MLLAGDPWLVIGDSNHDGVFGTSDLSTYFRPADLRWARWSISPKVTGTATFFTSGDLVAALQVGAFERPFTSCLLGVVRYESPNAFGNLQLESDGSGIFALDSIARIVSSHQVEKQLDGPFLLTLNTRNGQQFTFTLPTLSLEIIVDSSGGKWRRTSPIDVVRPPTDAPEIRLPSRNVQCSRQPSFVTQDDNTCAICADALVTNVRPSLGVFRQSQLRSVIATEGSC